MSEIVIFIGIPASGKTSFYKERFFPSHVYVSLDQVKTRSAEGELLTFCLGRNKSCVIDNTNVLRSDRARYIAAAKSCGFKVIGYCFLTQKEEALVRNEKRPEADQVPDVAIHSAYAKLEYPEIDEGFDELHFVRLTDNGFSDQQPLNARAEPIRAWRIARQEMVGSPGDVLAEGAQLEQP